MRFFFLLSAVLGLFVSTTCAGSTALALNLCSRDSVSWRGHFFKGIGCPIDTRCSAMSSVRGSDEPGIFETYSEGTITLSHAVPEGTYDVTLLFAEPRVSKVGARVFDAVI